MLINLASAYQCFLLKERQMDCDKSKCMHCYDDNLKIVNFNYCKNLPCITFDDSTNDELKLNIISPQDNSIFASRSTLLEITSNKPVSLNYGFSDTGRMTRLARNITHYSKKFTFREGINNLTIKAIDSEGINIIKELSVFVDSKRPLIRTSTKLKLTNGTFTIKFQEDNVKIIRFFINNNLNEISLDNCKRERSYFVCVFFVDLGEYNNQEINYYFEVEDIAGNKDATNKIKAKVDYKIFKELVAHTMKGGIENE